jgi:hypothetical protein
MKKLLKVAMIFTKGKKTKLILLGLHAAYTGYKIMKKKK